MREDYLFAVLIFLNNVGPNVIKIRKIIPKLENIVITFDKDKTSIKPRNDRKIAAMHTKVAQ
jgi:hypothetical protein